MSIRRSTARVLAAAMLALTVLMATPRVSVAEESAEAVLCGASLWAEYNDCLGESDFFWADFECDLEFMADDALCWLILKLFPAIYLYF